MHDGMVRLSKENQEPIFLTRNGDSEMVLLPIELWEKREAELDMLSMLLKREQNRKTGTVSFSMEKMKAVTEDVLCED